VTYIDFNKEFDSVSHEKLLFCSDLYGIRDNLLVWLRRFFSERTHCTRVGASLSSFANLLSCVVQGSGKGSVAFLCFLAA